MVMWEVSEPHINVWLYDEPIAYQPGLGPKISFKLSYKQRDTRLFYDGVGQNYTGVGPAWHCSWVSYLYRNYTIEATNTPTLVCDPPGSSNCTVVWIETYITNYDDTATVVMADGGERTFTAGGSTHEYYSRGTMTRTTNPDGSWNTATLTYPDGSKEEYAQVTTLPVVVGGTEILYRKATYDRFGNATRFYYDTGDPLLRYVVDTDSRTNTLNYTGSLITSVQDPFGRTATLTYDTNSWLASITDPESLTSSFDYNHAGWITNLHTPYGDTTFQYVANGFGVSSGVVRAVKVTDAAGGVNVYALYQTSSYHLYTAPPEPIGVEMLPDGHPKWRTSFHWGPKQSPLLPANLNEATDGDFRRARARHWLHDTTWYTPGVLDYAEGLGLSQTLSMEVIPSADSDINGLVTLYDYEGKNFGDNPAL